MAFYQVGVGVLKCYEVYLSQAKLKYKGICFSFEVSVFQRVSKIYFNGNSQLLPKIWSKLVFLAEYQTGVGFPEQPISEKQWGFPTWNKALI